MDRTDLVKLMDEAGIPTHDMEVAVALFNLALDNAGKTAYDLSNGCTPDNDGRGGSEWLYSEPVDDAIYQLKVYD